MRGTQPAGATPAADGEASEGVPAALGRKKPGRKPRITIPCQARPAALAPCSLPRMRGSGRAAGPPEQPLPGDVAASPLYCRNCERALGPAPIRAVTLQVPGCGAELIEEKTYLKRWVPRGAAGQGCGPAPLPWQARAPLQPSLPGASPAAPPSKPLPAPPCPSCRAATRFVRSTAMQTAWMWLARPCGSASSAAASSPWVRRRRRLLALVLSCGCCVLALQGAFRACSMGRGRHGMWRGARVGQRCAGRGGRLGSDALAATVQPSCSRPAGATPTGPLQATFWGPSAAAR